MGNDTPVSRRSRVALDALNVFLSDVRDGIGPFLAVYLLARGWDAGRIGVALAVMTAATVLAQTPAGGLVDRSKSKRLLVAAAALLVAAASLAIVWRPTFAVVAASQAVAGAVAAILTPAIGAITLGLVGPKAFDRRIGRNEAFNHGGNVAAAAAAGALGWTLGAAWVFYLLAAMAVASAASVAFVRGDEIDHDAARGAKAEAEAEAEADGGRQVSGLRLVLADRRLLAFAASVVLFHFANAAMLPLVGMKLAAHAAASAGPDAPLAGAKAGMLAMAACILVAQAVMVPVAAWAGRACGSWGRRPVFLVGFLVLPVRGLLYLVSDSPYYLIAVQALDGVGAGVFGVVSVVMIADLTRGTGRFNLVQGVIATALGLGASLSTALAGYLVSAAGYNAAFLALAAIAAIAAIVFWRTVPETGPDGVGSTATPPPSSSVTALPQPALR